MRGPWPSVLAPAFHLRDGAEALPSVGGNRDDESSMTTEQHVTYCRICEALCGVVATVEDGRLVKLRPDDDNPLSRGRVCPKGIAMVDVQNDPDRVLTRCAGARTEDSTKSVGTPRWPTSLRGYVASWTNTAVAPSATTSAIRRRSGMRPVCGTGCS